MNIACKLLVWAAASAFLAFGARANEAPQGV